MVATGQQTRDVPVVRAAGRPQPRGRVARLLTARPAEAPFRARWAAVGAVASGLLGVLAFPRFGLWPLAFVSVAGLSVVVHGRRARQAAWIGLLYGLAFFVPLLSWTGIYVGPVPWLILGLTEAGYVAGLGAVLSVAQRLPAGAFWAGCAWILQEFVRDRWPFGGFPWGRLAFSQAESPVRWFAALGGAPLVSFVVATGGAALGLAASAAARWSRHGDRPRAGLVRGVGAGLAVAVAVPLVGGLLAIPLRPAPDRDGRTATVALIQGNVPDIGLAFEQRAEQVLDNHIQQTMRLAAEIKAGRVARPSLVVWPENASDVDPFTERSAYERIDATVKAVGAPILVGAILQGPGNHRRNAGILWSPTTGPGATYIKRHPVPFAEYIPLRSIARIFSSAVNDVQQDMVAGSGNGLLRGGPYPIGDVICFEVAYDALVRSSVRAGAQLLVVQTNNATFGHTAETYQQLAMSQLRAVETGRTVLQVATTGKSAVIGLDGVIREQSPRLYAPAVLTATVPLRTGQTLAMRLGPVPEYVLTALALIVIAWTMLRWWRYRNETTTVVRT